MVAGTRAIDGQWWLCWRQPSGTGSGALYDPSQLAAQFFVRESRGMCFPCRIGTQRLTERLAGNAGPADPVAWDREVEDLGNLMKATSACGRG